ncbi:MAG: S8 family serine peptidase, partial [Flavobacteriaceae bacterium]
AEINGNNKDDDNNGYIDDIHGWNFLGNPKGESIIAETLGITRLYREYSEKFAGKDKFNISAEEKPEYLKFLKYKKEYETEFSQLKERAERNEEEAAFFSQLIPPLQKALKKEVFSTRDLNRFKTGNAALANAKQKFLNILARNEGLTAEKLIAHYEEVAERIESLQLRLDHNYNMDFNGRTLIGDNDEDKTEKFYGNQDVTKRSEHGTHVSGIIAATRDNDLGVQGIANKVQVMAVRAVPMGDEADKDVANGIRYAVDNGAKIINMSFGKGYSPYKEVVDAAVKYAEEKGVLLVHGSGNDGKNIDLYYSYPSPLMEDGTLVSNWIEVGASSPKKNEELPASFSNYGKKSVDIFAPGVDIYATLPGSKYGTRSGTSMASPVVAGVAALIRSHFPEFSPAEVKEILIASGDLYDHSVTLPGDDVQIKFASLSKSGKVVNAYKAVELAIAKRKAMNESK